MHEIYDFQMLRSMLCCDYNYLGYPYTLIHVEQNESLVLLARRDLTGVHRRRLCKGDARHCSRGLEERSSIIQAFSLTKRGYMCDAEQTRR